MERREATVSGLFYPEKKKDLENTLEVLFEGLESKKQGKALIAPHAGYLYSGRTAATGYNSLEEKADSFIVLGPNHTGLGAKMAVSSLDWETPLGTTERNTQISDSLVSALPFLEYDNEAHQEEHSIEVQLPFIQYLWPHSKIVAISMMGEEEHLLKSLGEELARTVIEEEKQGRNVCIVASSDFSHYVPKEYAEAHDLKAIKRITALDIGGYAKIVRDDSLTICGHSPIISLLYSAKMLKYKARMLKYCTSFLARGEEPVVGYSAIEFY